MTEFALQKKLFLCFVSFDRVSGMKCMEFYPEGHIPTFYEIKPIVQMEKSRFVNK